MIRFNDTGSGLHQCTSERRGDWMIWRCPHCPGYERRLNWVTGEMTSRRGGSTARHMGGTDAEGEREAFRQSLPLN